MKIIEKNKKTTIILQDGDILSIQTLKANPVQIEIQCHDGTIIVDEVTSTRIKEIKEEQNQLKKLKEGKK